MSILGLLLSLESGLSACGRAGGEIEGFSVQQAEPEVNQAEGLRNREQSWQQEQPEQAGQQVSGQDATVQAVGYPRFAEVGSLQIQSLVESEGIYCILADGYYGYMTETGEAVTPFVYEAASPFSEGIACVCLDGKYGYIDRNGETALAFTYDYATPFVEGLAYFSMGDTYGFMDQSGEPVFCLGGDSALNSDSVLDCDSVSSFQEGLAWFSIDGKYGYMDHTGKVIITPVFDDAGYFQDGLAIVRVGGGYGVIDALGREVIPADYDELRFEEGFVLAKADGRAFCFRRDEAGEMALLLSADVIRPLSAADRVLLEFLEDSIHGVADADGTVLLETDIDDRLMFPRTGEWVVVSRYDVQYGKDLYALMDFHGNELIPFGHYDYMSTEPGGDLLYVGRENKYEELYGCFDVVSLTERIPLIYNNVSPSRSASSYLAVYQEGKGWGVIDSEGSSLYPLEYDYVSVFENGWAALWKDGLTTLCDSHGQVIYQTLSCREITWMDGCYQVELEDKYQYVTLSGERVGDYYRDVEAPVNGQNGLFVAYGCGSEAGNMIVRTAEAETDEKEVLDAILKNAITPRLAGYYEVFMSKVKETWQMEDMLSSGARPLCKLYRVDGFERPVLCSCDSAYSALGYSDVSIINGFYFLHHDLAQELVISEEEHYYITDRILWFDKEEGRVLPGAVRRGGDDRAVTVYGAQEDALWEERSFVYDENFDGGWLPETPELFYDYYGVPYTAETFPMTYFDGIISYFVDGEQVTMERYQEELERYERLDIVR